MRVRDRKIRRTRRLFAESLEDRRLLAANLDLIPAAGAGTVTEESGRTVVTVAPARGSVFRPKYSLPMTTCSATH